MGTIRGRVAEVCHAFRPRLHRVLGRQPSEGIVPGSSEAVPIVPVAVPRATRWRATEAVDGPRTVATRQVDQGPLRVRCATERSSVDGTRHQTTKEILMRSSSIGWPARRSRAARFNAAWMPLLWLRAVVPAIARVPWWSPTVIQR
jgi:hypothetical protein